MLLDVFVIVFEALEKYKDLEATKVSLKVFLSYFLSNSGIEVSQKFLSSFKTTVQYWNLEP